ncbi:MAG: Bifunctional protein GlmU [Candidatus Omnitrophica bacterium]|nr:Bifunctional protein GlmU [Candidatus Omnitrophota bacterium]
MSRQTGRTAVLVLAAGRGTRLKSDLPKALHPICGRPMLGHLLESASRVSKDLHVVAGYGYDQVRRAVGGRVKLVRQQQLLGSGHAVLCAGKVLKNYKTVVVLYCDTPLLRASTIEALVERRRSTGADCVLLSAELARPTGYGRILRSSDGSVRRIVEENDATEAERRVREINVGSYAFDGPKLWSALRRIERNPLKKEYYLTDAVGILASEGRVEAVVSSDAGEVLGANSRPELMALQAVCRRRLVEEHAERGVIFRDPDSAVLDADVRIGEGTVVHAFTVIEEGSVIGKGCSIGPFARIRGASRIADGATVGNFVEVVRSKVGGRSQAKHLSYLGDAVVGRDVNVGAGTITANYDGKSKHRTVIADGAQVGSGTVLVAPVRVGRRSRTGAGAVVTRGRHVPDGAVVAGVPARRLGR